MPPGSSRKEKFLSPVKWINNLKLKASYGVLGNQSLNLAYGSTTPNYYLYHDFYEVDNFNNSPSFSFYAKGNSALQWERSGTFNVGFESRLFNALELNVDYFVRRRTTCSSRSKSLLLWAMPTTL